MRVIYGGIRGSYPVADADRLVYGGETTAVLIEGSAGERVMIDAGTGIRLLNARLADPATPLLMLMTHYHLDHVIGFPQLAALYQPGREITIAAPPLEGQGPESAVSRLLVPPYWPISLHELPAAVSFVEIGPAGLPWGNLSIRWIYVTHQGGCAAYRIDEPGGGSLVLATDIEWAASGEDARREFLHFCREPSPVSLLCFDGAFTPEEYSAHRDWGHSTWEEAVAIGRAIPAGQTHIIHHLPSRTDAALDALSRRLEGAHPPAAFARGGQIIDLGSSAGS